VTPFIAKLIWWGGIIGWYVIRYPHQRRSRKIPIMSRRARMRERVLLAISFTGLFIAQVIYVTTGEPQFAGCPFHPVSAWLGTLVFAFSLLLFYRTHRDLGRFWSVTLEIRQTHTQQHGDSAPCLLVCGWFRWRRVFPAQTMSQGIRSAFDSSELAWFDPA
jgi:hypothetical protein